MNSKLSLDTLILSLAILSPEPRLGPSGGGPVGVGGQEGPHIAASTIEASFGQFLLLLPPL